MGVRLTEAEINDQLKSAFLDPSGAGDNSLVAAPGAGFKIVVFGYQITNGGTANNVRFRSAANSVTSLKALAINGGTNVVPGERPLFECNANEALNINLSGATAVGVDLQFLIARV